LGAGAPFDRSPPAAEGNLSKIRHISTASAGPAPLPTVDTAPRIDLSQQEMASVRTTRLQLGSVRYWNNFCFFNLRLFQKNAIIEIFSVITYVYIDVRVSKRMFI
jgi:hypothetical protein